MGMGLIKISTLAKLDKNTISAVVLATLATLQLLLYWRSVHDVNQFIIQAVFIVGLFWGVHQKQRQLKPDGDLLGNLLGIIIILLVLFRAKYIFFVEASVFAYFSPWLILIGYILLVEGLSGIKKYRREIIVCILIIILSPLMVIITGFLESGELEQFSVEVISAKLTSFMLWYLGFEPTNQGTIVYVNGGAIDIYLGCTAIPLLSELLKIALITVLFFRNLCRNFWLLFIMPVIISTVLSIIRLVIMALVVNDEEAFNFWHGIQGGNLFTTLAFVIFFGILLFTAPPHKENPKPSILTRYESNTPTWLLLSSSVTLLLILSNFIIDTSPVAGANRIADYQFPKVINISDWQLKDTITQPLIPVENEEEDTNPSSLNRSHLPLAVRSYLYQKGDDTLTVNLRYIVNTYGELQYYYYMAFENLPQSTNYFEGSYDDNYYLEFESEGKRYVTACLNVEGKTTVTGSQFLAYTHQVYKKPAKVLNWLMGKQVLRDQRCLWIELSSAQNSPLTRSEMMEVWQNVVNYWRSNFPPLRGMIKNDLQ